MSTLRKVLMRWLPYLAWTASISLGYSFLAYLSDAYLLGTAYSAEYYYDKGLFLLAPFALFAYGVKRAKRLWQYLFFSLVCLGGIYIVTGCLLFTAFSVVICVVWCVNRIQRQLQLLDEELPEPCVLEETNGFLFMLPLLYFFAAGNTQQPLFQKMAVLHFVYLAVLIFVHAGLMRFEDYVRLCELNANVPSHRILETGTRIFVGAGLATILFLTPVIHTQYHYVSTVIAWEASEEEVPLEQEKPKAQQGSGNLDLSTLGSEQEPWIDLSWLAKLLEQVAVVGCWAGGAYLLIHWLYVMVVNFNKTQIEQQDVIESTLAEDGDEVNSIKRRQRLAEWLDFSETMRVRRRYKKALKKHQPKQWQTPTEMEQMAQKQMPELHAQYEQVRYGRGEG